jgi:hypothetical protein
LRRLSTGIVDSIIEQFGERDLSSKQIAIDRQDRRAWPKPVNAWSSPAAPTNRLRGLIEGIKMTIVHGDGTTQT